MNHITKVSIIFLSQNLDAMIKHIILRIGEFIFELLKQLLKKIVTNFEHEL